MRTAYYPDGAKKLDTAGYNTTTSAATQYTYDAAGRVQCTALRMNPTQYTTLPASACTLGPAGDYGPDRITKMVYNAAGEVLQEYRGTGTSAQQLYATHTYSLNGKEASVYDARGATHLTTYTYDGFDRLKTTTFPDGTTVQNVTIDADGNVKKVNNRAGETITYTFDRLDRMRTKTVPAAPGGIPANTVTWTYDLLNAVTNVSDTNGNGLDNTYDLAGRQLTASQTLPGMTGGAKTVTYAYDNGAGDRVNRSKMTWPDGYAVNYAYNPLNNPTTVTDSDGTVLATRGYDNLARPATLQYPSASNNIATSWSAQDELLTLTDNFAATANDVSFTNTYSPAHQIVGATISNTAYKYTPPGSGTDTYAPVNKLNQYPSVTLNGGSAQPLGYDTRGNLTSDGVLTLTYDPENRLMKAVKTGMTADYLYDPLGRRTTKTVSGTTTNFLHDGDGEIGEYDAGGALIRRFVPGPEIDHPIAMVTAAGVKTMFHTDKLGSVVAMSNATNGQRSAGPFLYDTFGNCLSGGAPCSTAGSPFLYTGQRFDPETGLYYYKARYYSASLGRFAQTDPVGYLDDYNLYAAMHNDPTNKTDPSGKVIDIVGSEEFKKKVQDDLQKAQQAPEGHETIDQLQNSDNHHMIVQSPTGNWGTQTAHEHKDENGNVVGVKGDGPVPNASSQNGTGSASVIFYVPSETGINTNGPSDASGNHSEPTFVALGHELGHSKDIDKGAVNIHHFNSTPKTPGSTPPWERTPVDLENSIRQFFDIPLRPGYYTSGGEND